MNETPRTFTIGTQYVSQLKFPIVAFHKDCVIVYRSMNALTISPVWSVKSRYFISTLIVGLDRLNEYKVYKITDASRSSSVARNLLFFIMCMDIEFTVNDVTESTNVEYIKTIILNDIESGGIWGEMGDSKSYMTEKVQKLYTLKDMFEFFTVY